MKKKIKITEYFLTKIVKRVINEINNEGDIYPKKVSRSNLSFCENTFKDPNHIEKCKKFENLLKYGKKNLREFINTQLSTYSYEIESNVAYHHFDKFSDSYRDRIDEVNNFIEKLKENGSRCDNLLKDIESLKDKEIYKEGYRALRYIKDEENKYEYSYFNRLNTNYSAVAIMLTGYAIDYNKINDDEIKVIEDFRENGQEYIKNVVRNYSNNLNTKIKHITNSIINTIATTRSIGSKSEREFINLLNNQGIDYVNTLDDFSFVDFLGVDLIVKFPKFGHYTPVQVKSSWPGKGIPSKLKKYCEKDCFGILVYKKNDEFKYKYSDGINIISGDITELF